MHDFDLVKNDDSILYIIKPNPDNTCKDIADNTWYAIDYGLIFVCTELPSLEVFKATFLDCFRKKYYANTGITYILSKHNNLQHANELKSFLEQKYKFNNCTLINYNTPCSVEYMMSLHTIAIFF